MLDRDAERYLWRRLTLVTFAGWAMFAAGPRPVSLVGVLVLTLGQWMTLRGRLPVSGYWLLFYPFCLLLGYVLGGLVGGNVQNVLDDISAPSAAVRYLGPGRPPSSYFIASTLSGACIGCLLGLGQWLLVRPNAANAGRAIVVHAVGLAMACASYALIHILLQRMYAGVYASAFWAGVFGIHGGSPSPAFDTFMDRFLRACPGVVSGIVAGIAMGASLVWCLRAQEEEALPASNAAAIGCATGACAVLAMVLGTVLLEVYPPAPGRKSAYFSEAFPILALLSIGSWVLAPIALLHGVRALRSVKMRQKEEAGRSLAWVGAVLGGSLSALYLLLLVLGLLVLLIVASAS